MKLKFILAVERANLTEQDEIRLLDMDGIEYGTEQPFKKRLIASTGGQNRQGKGNNRNVCRVGEICTGKRGF